MEFFALLGVMFTASAAAFGAGLLAEAITGSDSAGGGVFLIVLAALSASGAAWLF